MFSISVFSYWLKVCQWIVPLYTRMDTLHGSQWQVTAPYTDLSDNLWPPSQISVTSYGPPTQNSVTSYGPPTLISVTIGTRILKLKLKMSVKIKFFTNFTLFIMILRSFNSKYVEISVHLIVPLCWNSLFFNDSQWIPISVNLENLTEWFRKSATYWMLSCLCSSHLSSYFLPWNSWFLTAGWCLVAGEVSG